VDRAALLLAVSILCTSASARGDERTEQIFQLAGEMGASLVGANYAHAAKLAEEMIQLQRQSSEPDVLQLAESLEILGHVRLSLRDSNGAEAPFIEAHQLYSGRLGPLNPLSGRLLAALAKIYTVQGDPTKGAIAMDRAVALAPLSDVDSAINCAGVYERAGEWENARRALELAIKLAPDHPTVSNNLAYALVSSPGADSADFQRAEQLARASLAKRPDSAATSDTLGFALVRAGRHAEAREILEKVLAETSESLGPAIVVAQFHAALAAEHGGDPSRAAMLVQSAIDGAAPGVFDPAPAKELLARLTSRLPAHSGRLDDVR
jgi:tetratricopeptide (TPR) repeat protein